MVICFDGDRTLWDLAYDYSDCYNDLAHWMRREFGFQVPIDVIETSINAYIKYEHKKDNYHRSVFPMCVMRTFNSVYLFETKKTPPIELLCKAYQIGERIYDTAPVVKSNTYDVLRRMHRRYPSYPLFLVTAGDRVIQTSKIQETMLDTSFYQTHIVRRKTVETYTNLYRDVFQSLVDGDMEYVCENPSDCVMVGDSIKHDINPAIEAGWYAIYIPSSKVTDDTLVKNSRLIIAENLSEVPDIINKIRND